jgi:hypothetical protein
LGLLTVAMRKSTRRELLKLREVALHFLEGQCCCFCHLPLIEADVFERYEPGSGEGVPLTSLLAITEHHRNGNHADNRKRNRTWAHRTCHKRFHAALRWREAHGFFPSSSTR